MPIIRKDKWTLQKANAKAQEIFLENNHLNNHLDTLTKKTQTQWYASHKKQKSVQYIRKIIYSSFAKRFIVCAIILNVIIIAFDSASNTPSFEIQYFDLIFISIYGFEFLMKVFCEPVNFWISNYNKFDAAIVFLSFLQIALSIYGSPQFHFTIKMLKATRSLRALRAISFIRKLQVVFHALVDTLKNNAIHMMVLLLLIMFIFGILGHTLFGQPGTVASDDWGSLGSCIYILWVYVSGFGWHHYQINLSNAGYVGSEVFSSAFIFFGSFMIGNLFIGVICQNMDIATENDKKIQLLRKNKSQQQKRKIFMKKHERDMKNLIHETGVRQQNFQEILEDLAGTLRNDDIVQMETLSCNITWLETFMTSLHHQENVMYRVQQAHFSIAYTLAELVDQRLKARQNKQEI